MVAVLANSSTENRFREWLLTNCSSLFNGRYLRFGFSLFPFQKKKTISSYSFQDIEMRLFCILLTTKFSLKNMEQIFEFLLQNFFRQHLQFLTLEGCKKILRHEEFFKKWLRKKLFTYICWKSSKNPIFCRPKK